MATSAHGVHKTTSECTKNVHFKGTNAIVSKQSAAPVQFKEGAIKLFSRLDIGHADFEGQQFVYCKQFKSVHKETRIDHVFFIPPLLFYDVGGGHRHSEFDLALDNVWYGRVALPFKIMMTVRTDSNQLRAWSVP